MMKSGGGGGGRWRIDRESGAHIMISEGQSEAEQRRLFE